LEVLFPEKTAHFGSTVPGKNIAASPKVTASLKVKRILEVLFPEKKSSAFWKYCSRKKRCRESKSQAHFGSTVPGKKVKRILEVLFLEKRPRLSRASAPALTLAQFYLFYFSGYSTSIFLFFRSTESPGKTRSVFTPPYIGQYYFLKFKKLHTSSLQSF
jgi:hypothetical protein